MDQDGGGTQRSRLPGLGWFAPTVVVDGTTLSLGNRPVGAAWERRHARIMAILAAHIPALLLFGLLRSMPVLHAVADVVPIALFAFAAASRSLSPRHRSVAASLGLMTAAAALVHLSEGRTEAHFLFFVLLGVLALYDDWLPYAAAVGFVLVEHGLIGALVPAAVFGRADAQQAPWTWAAVHGLFVLAACLVAYTSWRWREAERAVADHRLVTSEDQFRVMFQAAPIGMALVSLDGRFLRVNPALCDLVGYSVDDLLDSTFQAITHADDLDLDLEQVRACLAGKIDGYAMEKRYVHRDGHEVWVELNVALARDASGAPLRFVSQIIDVRERREAEASLAASEARWAAMVEHGSDLIAVTDEVGRLVYASPAYSTLLGIDPESWLGKPLQDHIHPDDRDGVLEIGADLATQPGASAVLEFRYSHADGSWRWVEATLTNRVDDPAVGGFVINTRDVTERVLAAEGLAHRATHDSLTGLPNRSLLEEHLNQLRGAAARHDEIVAALFVDVDHFKQVNDTFGHGTGDLLLVEVARRLVDAVRVSDVVFRLGGDEFVILASVRDEAAAHELASRACEAFTQPFVLGTQEITATSSVGVCTTGDVLGDADLLEAADMALYEAKAVGRNGWVAYLPHMHRDRRPAVDGVAERYERQVAESTEALIVHDAGVIVAASPPAVTLLEAGTPAALVGRRVFDLVASGSMDAARARQVAVEQGGWPRPEVIEVVGLTGRSVRVETSSAPVFWNGRLASQVTVRLADDRWAEIVRIGGELTASIDQAAVITDLDYRIVAWNDEAALEFGWSAEEAIGQLLPTVVPWAASDEEAAVLQHELESYGRWEGTATLQRRNGSTMLFDTVAQLIHDRNGNPIGIMAVHKPDSDRVPRVDVTVIEELASGIAAEQLVVAYQPIVDPAGNVVKVEALARWQHPTRGLLLPASFIPAAERSPVMTALTEEVLRQGTAQVAAWRRAGLPALELAVNISARELSDPALVDRVVGALQTSGLPASALWLEVTETALSRDTLPVDGAVAKLRSLGVRFALDDFGTGFATLAQLHTFPGQALKVDRMFVGGLAAGDDGDAAIVRSVLALGRELGLSVIAEGVETQAQHQALAGMGCELFQGYLFARPALPESAPLWMPMDHLDTAAVPARS